HDAVRIELPAGTYAPVFQWTASERSLPPFPRRSPVRWRWAAPAAILAAIAGLFAIWLRPGAEIEQFWEPMLATGRPVLACLGQSEYFMLAPAARRQLEQSTGPFLINPVDITRLHDGAVSTGMLHAVLSIYDFLGQHAKPVQV